MAESKTEENCKKREKRNELIKKAAGTTVRAMGNPISAEITERVVGVALDPSVYKKSEEDSKIHNEKNWNPSRPQATRVRTAAKPKASSPAQSSKAAEQRNAERGRPTIHIPD